MRKGSKVALKHGEVNDIFIVLSIKDDKAVCLRQGETDAIEYPVDELVTVAEFGEPIYPCLKPIDSVCNAPDSELWHTLIEADNYHALQLLEYLYAGKVDCIYIDPPYNSGAKDWKYNNNYVDEKDVYRHSKWLSFMEKRLRIAKRLLNSDRSVMVVTIDEREYHHLGCLLEELFPEAQIQMLSITINPSGAIRKNMFSRADEYAYVLFFGSACVTQMKGTGDEEEVRWWYLRRLEYGSRRGTVKGGTAQFYPIYIDDVTEKIVKIGDPLPHTQDRNTVPRVEGTTAVFPIRDDGLEMNWGVTGETLKRLLSQRAVRVSRNKKKRYMPFTIKYLSENFTEKIEAGRWAVRGIRDDGSKIVVETTGKITRATTVWRGKRYDAKTYGTVLLKDLIGDARFSFPKSLYSVADTLKYFLADIPNALVLDFFAGSGTTLHAVNLLNAEDGGKRRCVLVTNNEVSESEAKELRTKGYEPGDKEWEDLGIARYVTWPRTCCIILGKNINGELLQGNYTTYKEDYIPDEEKKGRYKKVETPESENFSGINKRDGFKANAAFFKLGFLDKNAVALGRQFKEMLPTLWMKSGAYGPCPVLDGEISDVLLFSENRFAVLTEETAFPELEAALAEHPEIETVYMITDYEAGYRTMAKRLNVRQTYQLYRDYLDNFRINVVRD